MAGRLGSTLRASGRPEFFREIQPLPDGNRLPSPPDRLSEATKVKIHYQHSGQITETAFVDLLRRSTLAERRPIDDPACVEAMLRHANLLCTAWDDSTLVGVARSLTDFEYCCYLSDLAVDQKYQRTGIGKALIRLTQSRLGEKAKIILLAAPKAEDYYRRIGFKPHQSAWILSARGELR